MDILTSLAIVAFAALIHASFQLSVSVLSLLGGHALSAKKSRARIIRLTTSYMVGVAAMTLLTISTISLISLHVFGAEVPLLVWAIGCGLVLGIGIATHYGAEAFSLGLTSVVSELIFILPSMFISALVLIGLPGEWQLAGIGIYTIVSMFGLFIAYSMIGSGHSLAHIQKWRTDNKRFLQFAAGSALIVLGFFVYVSKIMVTILGSA